MQQSLFTDPNATSNIQMALRWVHFVGGITWIGLLFFFNLVNVPFMKELDAPVKSKVFPLLMKRALWWFRWSSVVTVAAGIWYWMTILGADLRTARSLANVGVEGANFAHASGGLTIGSFFVIWTLAWALTFVGVCVVKLDNPYVVGVVYFVGVTAAAVVYVKLNNHGWESSRLISIGVGGGMGWMMMLNVWGVIWRFSKKLIRWTEEGGTNGLPMPPEAAAVARQTFLTSRANFGLAFPMLFFMAAASHYPVWR
jgi:uncharacterized membrane protein